VSETGKAERRVRIWPAAALATLFIGCVIYFSIALQPVVGVSGHGKPWHTGTAEVQSCESSGIHLGMVDRCLTFVRWDDGWNWPGEYFVTAARPISGSIRVDYYSTRRPNREDILPVDRPHWYGSTGTYYLLTFVAATGFAVAGGFLGYRLSRLLPEPPVPVKKFRRGVDRRENPGFNGPRRRKRR
jgi:hypothetical protein